jgi:hypothetical protein
MEYYFGARSFDPGSLRQGSVAWMVNAGLVRSARALAALLSSALDQTAACSCSRGACP